MIPCVCGHLGGPQKLVSVRLLSLPKAISGRWLDHIDMNIDVGHVGHEKFSGHRVRGSSECIRAHIQATRDIQSKRFSKNGSSDIVCNTNMGMGRSGSCESCSAYPWASRLILTTRMLPFFPLDIHDGSFDHVSGKVISYLNNSTNHGLKP
jgi:hypothetical protein